MFKLIGTMTATALLLASTAASATHNSFPGIYGNLSGPYSPPIWAGYSPSGIPDDTTTATPTVQHAFTLTGSVARDCSYFGLGDLSSGSAYTIPLGAIGVRNGDNELVNNLFNQNGDFTYDIATTTAGCNTNNTVTVTKNADGLRNTAAVGFDNTQFTNHIPYSVLVGIASATTNTSSGAVGQYTPMTVAANAASNTETLGAWRSSLHLTATIPAQTLGLVAGTYSDTITVTLAAQ